MYFYLCFIKTKYFVKHSIYHSSAANIFYTINDAFIQYVVCGLNGVTVCLVLYFILKITHEFSKSFHFRVSLFNKIKAPANMKQHNCQY